MMNDIGKTQTLDELADKLAIIEIIHAYARGVDRADSGILKSTCWEDAEVDYGGYKGLAHPFCESLPNAIKNYKNTQHQVSNTLIFLIVQTMRQWRAMLLLIISVQTTQK